MVVRALAAAASLTACGVVRAHVGREKKVVVVEEEVLVR
jgi:hypothetical protein